MLSKMPTLFFMIVSFVIFMSAKYFIYNTEGPRSVQGIEIAYLGDDILEVVSGRVDLFKTPSDMVNESPYLSCDMINGKPCVFLSGHDDLTGSVARLIINEGLIQSPLGGYRKIKGITVSIVPAYDSHGIFKDRKGDFLRVYFSVLRDLRQTIGGDSVLFNGHHVPVEFALAFSIDSVFRTKELSELITTTTFGGILDDLKDSKLDGLFYGKKIKGWVLSPLQSEMMRLSMVVHHGSFSSDNIIDVERLAL